MKTIFKKKLSLLIILIISFSTGTIVNAQGHGRHQAPPPLPDSTQIVKMMDELAKELSLSASQKAKVTELHFAHFQEAKEMMKNAKADREQNRKVMNANRKEFETQILALFSKEQKAKFEAFMKDKRPPHKDGQRSKHPKGKR